MLLSSNEFLIRVTSESFLIFVQRLLYERFHRFFQNYYLVTLPSTTKQRDCCYFSAESRRPVSDSFPSSFSYTRSSSSQDSSLSSATKEPLRKVSSDAKVESDPVWKRASGGPLSRQTSEGGAGRYGTTLTRQSSTDVGKGKPFTRQLSKGVSENKSTISN